MTDSFQEISHQNIVSRIAKAFVGAVVGLVLLLVAFGLLVWNESRAVDALRGLKEAARIVVEVAPSPVDPADDDHLVHVVGSLTPKGTLEDPDMGLRANDKIRLRRTVEMYQWKEDKTSTSSNNVGGGDTTRTTYTYAKAWSETPVNSSAFKHPEKHENGEMDLRTQVFTNSDVALGDRQLGAPLLDQMSDFVSAAPPQTPPSGYQTVGRRLYKGDDADKPAVGDVRVTFAEVPAQTVSIMAQQRGGTLVPYTTKAGYGIGLVDQGDTSAAAMVSKQRSDEAAMTWGLRVAGFLAFFLALLLIAMPLKALANVLPFLGSIVGGASFLFALGLAIPLTLVTIALAWVVFRPLIGIGLLVVAVASFVAYYRVRRSRRQRLAATTHFLPA